MLGAEVLKRISRRPGISVVSNIQSWTSPSDWLAQEVKSGNSIEPIGGVSESVTVAGGDTLGVGELSSCTWYVNVKLPITLAFAGTNVKVLSELTVNVPCV